MVHFVEDSARAAELIKKNLESLGIESGFEIMAREVARALTKLEAGGAVADFIFIDPPYRMERAYGQVLNLLAGSNLLKPRGLVIAEHHKKFDPGSEFGVLRRVRELKQGDAMLSFYRSRTSD